MNTIKYRPVGSPNAPVVKVRVTQTKLSKILRGQRRPPTVREADRIMTRKGYVRAKGGKK